MSALSGTLNYERVLRILLLIGEFPCNSSSSHTKISRTNNTGKGLKIARTNLTLKGK